MPLYLAYSKRLKLTGRLMHVVYEQEQRDRGTLRVIEYFAKPLNVTQGHSKRHCCEQCQVPISISMTLYKLCVVLCYVVVVVVD